MYYLLTALLLSAATSADVTATTADGTSLYGSLRVWNGSAVVLSTAEGERTIPADELLSLRWSRDQSPPAEATVTLLDGSILPITSFLSSQGSARVTLKVDDAAAATTVALPLDSVRAVRLQPFDAETRGQWEEIAALKLPSDLLVITQHQGQSLDYVEGILGPVDADSVEVTIDSQPMQVQRSKVAGLVYYRPEPSADQPARCLLTGPSGLRIAAAEVALDGPAVEVKTRAGVELRWPLADVALADFSAGKLVFLSDLEPASWQWTPWLELPEGATLAAAYGAPHRDRSAYGGPLRLWYPDDEPQGISSHHQSFDKGLAVRSRTELVYRLPRGYRRLLALAGIEPETNASGDVTLTIAGDGRELWRGHLAGHKQPQPIDVDVEGVRQLEIVVDYGEKLDTGDWLNLCNARILK